MGLRIARFRFKTLSVYLVILEKVERWYLGLQIINC